jgi:hypothetical protein
MIIYENTVFERENTAFIYSGLGSISDKGREQLKNIAQSLVALQNRPGSPLPDSICREIIRDSANELV